MSKLLTMGIAKKNRYDTRIITKNDANGYSYVLSDGITHNVEVPLPEMNVRFKFFNLWATGLMAYVLSDGK